METHPTDADLQHPDEHFQNTEVASRLYFRLHSAHQPVTTWEWQPHSPCRSIVPVWLTTGWAFALLKLFRSSPSATTLFTTERFAMFAFSLAAELLSESLLHSSARSRDASILFNCAASTLVFLTRPFSNSTAALLMLPLLAIAERASAPRPISSHLIDLMWLLSALGVWTRFDFVAFAWPAVLFVLWRIPRGAGTKLALWHRWRLSTALVAVTVLVGVDSRYFAHPDRPWWRPVITPLNSLRYNLSSANLATHGVHPRWLHLLVNWPMLFGAGLPLALVAVRETRRDTLVKLCLAMLVSGTALLSIQPHQEARFLLPATAPLCLLLGRAQLWTVSRSVKILWLIHALVVAVTFGFLHQGGLLPALIHINTLLASKTDPFRIVVWKTYMPPLHLMLPSRSKLLILLTRAPFKHLTGPGDTLVPHQSIDLAGAPWSAVVDAIANTTRPILLVAPWYALRDTGADLKLLFSRQTHVDFDSLSEGFGQGVMSLGVYEISDTELVNGPYPLNSS